MAAGRTKPPLRLCAFRALLKFVDCRPQLLRSLANIRLVLFLERRPAAPVNCIDALKHRVSRLREIAEKCGVSADVSKAVFSGVKADGAMDYIRRINHAKTGKPDLPRDLDNVFVHLKALNTARNDLVHLGSEEGDDFERIVTNELKALTDKHVRSMRVSTESLQHMADDCRKVIAHLLVEMSPQSRSNVADLLTRAWRYKPPQDQKAKARKSE